MVRTCSKLGAFPVLLMTVVLSGTGCQEHKRLKTETAAITKELQELRPQVQTLADEAASYSNALNDLRNNRFTGQDSALEANMKTLEGEVSTLQSEKSRLEKEIQAVEEEHQLYKKENS